MCPIKKAAMWRAISYVYAPPAILLAAFTYGGHITWLTAIGMAAMLFFLLMPAAAEIDQASLNKALGK